MTDLATPENQRRIIVLEREPFWEPELKRQFSGEPVAVRGCRTLRDLDALAPSAGECVVVIDVGGAIAEVLRWSSQRLTERRKVPTVVIAGRDASTFQWHAREAGVMAVVPDVMTGHELARLCRRQWQSGNPTNFQTSDTRT